MTTNKTVQQMRSCVNNFLKWATAPALLLMLSWSANAQEATAETGSAAEPSAFATFLDRVASVDLRILILLGIVLVLILIILVMMGYMVYLLNYLVNADQAVVSQQTTAVIEKRPGFFARLNEKLVTGKLYNPEYEKREMLLDHNYDGIQEMNYGMPPWLTTFFLVTMGFGVVYLINMYGFGYVQHQDDEYQQEVKVAAIMAEERSKKMANAVDENSVKFTSNATVLQEGKDIYMANCKACHGASGGGGVGPNLTDKYWLHGGSINDVFKVVKYGVPDKGMISWQTKLNPAKISAVSSYILTMQGTTPENPKEPQGEEYSGEDVVSKETASN
jgi:cytochrome c oxidase cbb3-type subunit 3